MDKRSLQNNQYYPKIIGFQRTQSFGRAWDGVPITLRFLNRPNEAIADPGSIAVDLIFIKPLLGVCLKSVKIEIGVAWVVVRDEPARRFGLLDEVEGVEGRGVAPACFVEVFFRGVLRFVDEEIAAGEELDETLMRIRDLLGDVI